MRLWKKQENKDFSFYQVREKTDPIDPLYWLKETPIFPKFYWESRDRSFSMAAAGVLKNFSSPSYFSEEVTLFSLLPFDEVKKGFPWENFPTEKTPLPKIFALPRFELHTEKDCSFQIENASSVDQIPFPSIEKGSSFSPKTFYSELKGVFPSSEEWNTCVKKALQKIQKKEVEKIVLARVKELLLDSSFSLYEYLAFLREKRKNTFVFAYIPNEEEAFFSFSPERLYKREGCSIFVEAIAGTCVKKGLFSLFRFMQDAKEKREFQIVQDALENVLLQVCTKVEKPKKKTLISTQNLHHFYSLLKGELSSFEKEEELLKNLHPTPATLGLPKEEALAFLEESEPFTRGYYAAPLGWIRPDKAEFIAGIRSGLVRGRSCYLFSGTGLVEGSCPKKEWNELNHKLTFYEQNFQHL